MSLSRRRFTLFAAAGAAAARLPRAALALAAPPGAVPRGDDADAAPLVGTRAPELPPLPWLDGRRRDLRALAGHVVVVRNFTSGCPYCESTIPALARIARDYRARGVQVLGVYHPKPPRPVAAAEAAAHARALGATFPVAIDADWALVKRWWLDRVASSWTSITWVLDRGGAIRHIHPGGEYHPGGDPTHARCRADEQRLRAVLDHLSAEPRPARP